MTILTPRFKFPVPDFAIKPWHANLLACLVRIDEVIYQSVVSAGTVPWSTVTPFTAGQSVVDTLNGQFFVCLVSHTSGSSTFASDRHDNPSFWGLSTVAPENKGPWVSGTAYKNTDYVTFNNGYYVCLLSHTATVFSEDLALGMWSVLIDLAPTLNNIAVSLEAIQDFNKVYLGSKSADPTVDNEGQPLINGAMYFNTTINALKIFNIGPGWTTITAGAPGTATFLVKDAEGALSAERVVTDSVVSGGLVFDWATSGIVKAGLRAAAADRILVSTGVNAWTEALVSSAALGLLDDSTNGAMRTTLGLGDLAIRSTNGSSTQFLRGDGEWASLGLGTIVTINLDTNPGHHLCGDGNWRAFGNVATVNTNSNGAYFLNGNGIWAIPPDTVGSVTAANWGCILSGTTVILNSNNWAGMGSTMLITVSATTGEHNPNNIATTGNAPGSWRMMHDGSGYYDPTGYFWTALGQRVA